MKKIQAIRTSPTSVMLELNAAMLSAEDQIRFFGKTYDSITANEQLTFIQQEDYEFSFDALLQLDLDLRYKYLKKGEYPLQVRDRKVQVLLTLSQTKSD